MKKSRTIRTCEDICLYLIQEFDFRDEYQNAMVDKAIVVCAGGDPRTLHRYQRELLNLGFLIPIGRSGAVSVNLKKLNYQQLKIQESLLVLGDDEPP